MTPRLCPTCNGSGEVWHNSLGGDDPQYDDPDVCPLCNGSGLMPPRRPELPAQTWLWRATGTPVRPGETRAPERRRGEKAA